MINSLSDMFSEDKWQKMDLNQKMGNLASEVAKTFYWKTRDEKTAFETAERALELFDLTADNLANPIRGLASNGARSAGLSELLKLRSVFCDTFFGFGQFNSSEQAINNYFSPFISLHSSQF